MKSKIAIIYEGVKAEQELFKNIEKNFFASNQELTIISLAADGNIYMLWERLKKEHKGVDVLKEMLEVFDNETEYGKLYISYPMVEAIKTVSLQNKTYSNFYIAIDESAEYKKNVGNYLEFANYSKFTKEMWMILCEASRKQASLIVTYKYISDYYEFIKTITQKKIYAAQKELFIHQNKCIAVLNSIPLFLIEYFKIEFWLEVTKKMPEKPSQTFW